MAAFDRSYDVVVAGGGIAGVAAAVAAARTGAHVALVEKTVFFGGLATAGLVNLYLPLCDGRGRQVTFGLAEELLHRSLRYGPGEVPSDWQDPASKSRYQTPFSPAAFILALDEMLEEAGVYLWLDTLVSRPVVEDRRLVALEVENKSGRGTLRASCVIDATVDADLAFRAGAPCEEATNWLSIWAGQTSLDRARQAVEAGDGGKLLDVLRLGGDAWGQQRPEDSRKYVGTDGAEVSRFVLDSRRLLREFYQHHQPQAGRTALYPLFLPAMAQFRTTRRILGRANLTDDDVDARFDDSIGLIGNWWRSDEVWEVPFGALVPQGVVGLLVAGRCMASAGEAWEVTRAIPGVAMTGQVAGLAAAMAVDADTTPDQLDVAALQRRLTSDGFVLHRA